MTRLIRTVDGKKFLITVPTPTEDLLERLGPMRGFIERMIDMGLLNRDRVCENIIKLSK